MNIPRGLINQIAEVVQLHADGLYNDSECLDKIDYIITDGREDLDIYLATQRTLDRLTEKYGEDK